MPTNDFRKVHPSLSVLPSFHFFIRENRKKIIAKKRDIFFLFFWDLGFLKNPECRLNRFACSAAPFPLNHVINYSFFATKHHVGVSRIV